jgi:hypothetical protein
LAPEVGLEPTTLRLTALESVYSPVATVYYKTLFLIQLDRYSLHTIAIRTNLIMPDFEGAWVQKWVQSSDPVHDL